MKSSAFALLCAFIVCCWPASVIAQQYEPASGPNSTDADSATQLAFRFLGVDANGVKATSVGASASAGTFQDSSLQFTSSMMGRSVWFVRVEGVSFQWSPKLANLVKLGKDKHVTRSFDVIVDVKTGTVIKAVSMMPASIAAQTAGTWDSLNAERDSYTPDQVISVAQCPPAGGLIRALAERAANDPTDAIEIEASLMTMKWTATRERCLTCPDDTIPVWWISMKYLDYETLPGRDSASIKVLGAEQFYQIIDLSSDKPRMTVSTATGTRKW